MIIKKKMIAIFIFLFIFIYFLNFYEIIEVCNSLQLI